MQKARSLLLVLFGVALATACKPGGPAQPYEVLDADANALRSQFNADAGKVRVVMLVAPS